MGLDIFYYTTYKYINILFFIVSLYYYFEGLGNVSIQIVHPQILLHKNFLHNYLCILLSLSFFFLKKASRKSAIPPPNIWYWLNFLIYLFISNFIRCLHSISSTLFVNISVPKSVGRENSGVLCAKVYCLNTSKTPFWFFPILSFHSQPTPLNPDRKTSA